MHFSTICNVFLFVFTLIKISGLNSVDAVHCDETTDLEYEDEEYEDDKEVPCCEDKHNHHNDDDDGRVEKVKVKIYYESMCPFSRKIFYKQIIEIVRKLGPQIKIYLNPYGDAVTKHRHGRVEFQCQHGPDECYGNKIHACAIYTLGNRISSVPYLTCLMDRSRTDQGSDDNAIDFCSREHNVDGNWIKRCAKGSKGSRLLELAGKVTIKINFPYVPYVIINGQVSRNPGGDLFDEICGFYQRLPQPCVVWRKTRKEHHTKTEEDEMKMVCELKKTKKVDVTDQITNQIHVAT